MSTMKESMAEFNVFMEALLNTDGSNTLDTVVSTATNQLTVNNANQFRDNNDYDLWTALSGTFLGTVTVQSVGSAGVDGTGFLGIKYFQVNSNTGSIGGL